MKLVNVYLNLVFFTVFLKNRNNSSKIKRSKVTDYAALSKISNCQSFHQVRPEASSTMRALASARSTYVRLYT